MTMSYRWACAVLALVAAACGGETAGELISIEVALRSEPAESDALASFETDTGYSVELDEASVRVGPILAFSPEARAEAPRSILRLVSDALVPVAQAHGGVDLVSGRLVRAEWLEPVTLDALDGETVVLGEVQAEAGAVDAVTLELAREGAEGAQLELRGEAARDGQTLAFSGELILDDNPLARRIELVHEDFALTEGGRLTIVVHPDVWLRDAELARAPVDAEGMAQLAPDNQPGRALEIGARSPAAYSIEWRP